MAFHYRAGERVRTLGQGATDSFAATRLTADYQTLAAAIADSANWDVLSVFPGTYTFGQETLPAGKGIVGTGRDICILQSTHNVADEPALSCGNQSYLQDIYIRAGGTPGAVNRIHLIDFGGAAAGQYLVLNNVKVDNGGGTQPFAIDAPVYADNCIFNLYHNADRYFGVEATPSRCTSCQFTSANGDVTYAFRYTNAAGGITCVGCTFEAAAAGSWCYVTGADVPMSFTGCSWTPANRHYIVSTSTSTGLFTFSGCNFSGDNVIGGVLGGTSKWRFKGCTGYPTGSAANMPSSGATIYEIDGGLPLRALTDTILVGWESIVSVSAAFATAITLPNLAKFGAPNLLIKDYSGNAGRYNITVTRSSTDTIDGTADPYVIREDFGWVLLTKDENPAPDQWRIVASSRDTLGQIQGFIQTYGFFQRGSLSSSGGVSFRGKGLYGSADCFPAGTFGVDASGSYLSLTSGAVIGDRAYAYTSAPSGPLAADANWDLIFFWTTPLQSNDQRIVCGAWDLTGGPITTPLDSNTPDGTCALVIKESGGTNAKLYTKTTAAGVVVAANFSIWTPLPAVDYYVVIRKRATVFLAYVYNLNGVLIDAVTATNTLLAGSDSALVNGVATTAAVARELKIRSWYGHQFPSTLTY